MDPFALTDRAQLLLDQARTLLEGPAAAYDSSGRSAPDSRAPTGQGLATFDQLVQLFQNAGDGEQLLRAIHAAELALYRARYARRVSRRTDSPERVRLRVLREWVGSTPEEVSDFEPIGVADVCRLRARAGQDPLTGRAPETAPQAERWATPEERAVQVQRIKVSHPHLSARAIGMMVGASHPTVLADLARPLGDR